jgi:FlaA1/EpsC-like NDP-sugar epimerase
MGATKRFSELLFQEAAGMSSDCTFTSVRFGNVLGSSGSVIPIFKQQIMTGGPVTVTHPDVTRYFMSINEAAVLILSAVALAKGGEVFVLDMGAPIKILDLAKKLISLLGNSNSSKDLNYIPIEFIGMSKGEKLHEELVISGKREDTKNPKIFKVVEPAFSSGELEEALGGLLLALQASDEKMAFDVLSNYFPTLTNTI